MINSVKNEVRAYILASSQQCSLSDKQIELIIEQIDQAGHGLEIDKGRLVLSYVDQTGIHKDMVNIEDLIDIACKFNYGKLMEVKTQLEFDIADISERCYVLMELCSLVINEQALNNAFRKTQKIQNLLAAVDQNKM